MTDQPDHPKSDFDFGDRVAPVSPNFTELGRAVVVGRNPINGWLLARFEHQHRGLDVPPAVVGACMSDQPVPAKSDLEVQP